MKKPFLFALIATFSTLTASAAAANETAEYMSSSSGVVTVQYVLTGCVAIPPNGYITVGAGRGHFQRNCGVNAGGVYNLAYTYESYFDKPVGAKISLCFMPPAQLPNGWFEIPVGSNCGIGSAGATIERFY